MLSKTTALVLKTIKYGDTSLIVKVYCDKYGLLSLIVNGVRSSKSTHKAVLFQPLNFLDLVLYYRPGKALMRPKEYQHHILYESIPFNIVKTSIAQFLLEVLEQCLKEEEENNELFEYLELQFKLLDQLEDHYSHFHLNFLSGLMQHLGIMPENNQSSSLAYFNVDEGRFDASPNSFSENAEISASWSLLLDNKLPINLNKELRKDLTNLILKYYGRHIDGFKPLKSLKILSLVFS